MKKVPGLTHLGIPLHKNVLRVMVRELTVLSNQFPTEGILTYPAFTGVEHSLLQVPVCNTKESFFRSNRSDKFIDRSLESLIVQVIGVCGANIYIQFGRNMVMNLELNGR